MDKETLGLAIMLNMKRKLDEQLDKIDTAASLEEIAVLFDNAAVIVRDANEDMEGLDK